MYFSVLRAIQRGAEVEVSNVKAGKFGLGVEMVPFRSNFTVSREPVWVLVSPRYAMRFPPIVI